MGMYVQQDKQRCSVELKERLLGIVSVCQSAFFAGCVVGANPAQLSRRSVLSMEIDISGIIVSVLFRRVYDTLVCSV